MTQAHGALIAGGVSPRQSAALTGLARATAARRGHAAVAPTPAVSPASARRGPVNKLTELERRRVLAELTSERFVDLAPLQIYAQLLDRGVDEAQLQRVRCPIGMAIEADTPEEIAVSIVGELIYQRATGSKAWHLA